MTANADIAAVLIPAYGLAADAYCSPLGRGLINHTLLLHSNDQLYVAQRINREVFAQPQQLLTNALLVEQHLLASADYPLQVTRHLASADGRFLHGPAGDIRLMTHVPDSVSLEGDPSPSQAEAAAAAFACFAATLADLDPTRLHTVIPDFHDLQHRLSQFDRTLANDCLQRADSCGDDIRFVQAQQELLREWQAAVAELPLRVCHNDTKLNNLLVHRESGEPLAVIDLDTCMAGHLMTDFGDLVRSCASPEPEDSSHIEGVVARPALLTALARGYLRGLGDLPSAAERRSLALGARLVPFLQGLRFLSDYLNGDRYYGSRHPRHNLERARNQLALYRSICEQRDLLENLMEQVA